MKSIGERIRYVRVAKGYTQEALAVAIGSTKATICRYENDSREPSYAHLEEIAKALEVDVADLLPRATMRNTRVTMRDPNRIYKFCNQLATVWAVQAPDMRFGQFVECVFQKLKEEGKGPFYMEEDEMMAAIERLLNYWP